MRFRFLHFADAHLGYRQYDSGVRANDFFAAFRHVVDAAIRERVDFVIFAGDLFHKRSIDALTLNQAHSALVRLKADNVKIPIVGVEGNHELAYYDEHLGWLQYLDQRELITLLRPRNDQGRLVLEPYEKRRGSYVDVMPGVRVHGLPYAGASTANALEKYADALTALPAEGIEYSIFVAHTGVEGVVSGDVGSPSLNQWGVIRPHVDYVALGHIHKPFDYQDWIYNPGSLESCTVDEAEWPERGYYLVEVDTSLPRGQQHTATRHPVPRRLIVRVAADVDLYASQEELRAACAALAARRAADMGGGRFNGDGPVVDFLLKGRLGFDAQQFHVREIEEAVREATDAHRVLMRNITSIVPPPPMVDNLEREIMAGIFRQDRAYADHCIEWAEAAMEVKKMALEKVPPADLLEKLESMTQRIRSLPPAANSTDAGDEPTLNEAG